MTPRTAKRIALKICKPYVHDNGFARWMFPVIRNVAVADLVAAELISVQPMSGPALASSMYYLDYVYDSRWERFKRWLKKKFRLPGRHDETLFRLRSQ